MGPIKSAVSLFQPLVIPNYEDWGVHSILISGIIALASAVVYLYKTKESAIKRKDEQIMLVIKEHQDDLKDENQTMKEVMEKYNQFTNSIKEMVMNKRI